MLFNYEYSWLIHSCLVINEIRTFIIWHLYTNKKIVHMEPNTEYIKQYDLLISDTLISNRGFTIAGEWWDSGYPTSGLLTRQ